ncbi:MAG: hypothetical protein KAS53_09535 [Candidatus Cloacimonetes bacterium]|nr:hypothetical protein [Candidatus Cloacimonadota bacterium]
MNVSSKRKDIMILVISVILLSIEISLISNILFSKFYSDNKLIFFLINSILFLITISLLIKTMFVYDTKIHNSNIIFAYDTVKNKFVDIYCNPSTVNARVLYNSLNKKNKQKIQINDLLEKDKTEFFEFCNCLVVQLIFSRFLRNKQYKNIIDINFLKEVLVKFRYIDIDSILGGEEHITGKLKLVSSKLTLPDGFKLKNVSKQNMELDSLFGFVNFKWSIIVSSNTEVCKIFSVLKKIDLNNLLQVNVSFNMEYGFKPLLIFKKSTLEFEKFVNHCKNNMNKYDWKSCMDEFNSKVLIDTFDYLNDKFNNLEKKISHNE